MEALAFLALAFLAYLFFSPLVALARARAAQSALVLHQDWLSQLQARVAWLESEVAQRRTGAATHYAYRTNASPPPVWSPNPIGGGGLPEAAITGVAQPIQPERVSTYPNAARFSLSEPTSSAAPHDAPYRADAPHQDARSADRAAFETAAVDTGAMETSGMASAAAGATASENRPSLHWLTKVGAGAFLLGAALFFQHAIEAGWLGPNLKVLLGALVATAFLLTAEKLRASRESFAQALDGIGLSVGYLALWASASHYDVLPQLVAWPLLLALSALGAWLAYRNRGEVTLILTLVGGAIATLVWNAPDLPAAAVVWLLCGVTYAVARQRSMRIAPLAAVLLTAALMTSWMILRFEPASLHAAWSDRVGPLAIAFAFAGQLALATRRNQDALHASPLAAAAMAVFLVAPTALFWDAPAHLAWSLALGVVGTRLAMRHAKAKVGTSVAAFAAAATLLAISVTEWRASVGGIAQEALALFGEFGVGALVLGVAGGLVALSPEGPRRSPWMALSPIALVAIVASATLPHQPPVLALAALAMAGLCVCVGIVTRRVEPIIASSAAGLIAMVTSAPLVWGEVSSVQLAPYGLALAHGALHLGATVWLRRTSSVILPSSWWVAAIVAATLCAVGLLSVPVAHAPLQGGAAMIAAAVCAGWHLRYEATGQAQRTPLAGLAVAFVALAFAFMAAGPVLALLWATLGAVVSTHGARRRSLAIVWLGLGVLALSALHIAVVDVLTPERPLGAMVAMVGFGVSMLAVTHALGRAMRETSPPFAPGTRTVVLSAGLMGFLGAALLGALNLSEGQPPMVGALLLTGTLATAGAAGTAIGFGVREPLVRHAGLLLFGSALAKALLLDLWIAEGLARALLLVALGALLLLGGFFYARARTATETEASA